jgi:hypothetical protein
MIGPTDLLHPSPTPHFKTFHVFLIYCPKRQSFSTIHSFAPTQKALHILSVSVAIFIQHAKRLRRSKYYILSVSIALAIQHAKRMRRSKHYILSVSIALAIQHAKRMRRSNYYILSVSIALAIQHAKRMRRVIL